MSLTVQVSATLKKFVKPTVTSVQRTWIMY